MAQSNSVRAKSDLMFRHCWRGTLWMCARCPRRSLCFTLDMFFLLSLVLFLWLLSRFAVSGFIFSLTCLCFVFYFFTFYRPPLFSLSLCRPGSLLCYLPLCFSLSPSFSSYYLSLDLFLFAPTAAQSVYHSVPPSIRVPLCIGKIFRSLR